MSVLDTLRTCFARAREQHPGFTDSMSEAALQQILSALGGEQVIMPKTTQGRPGRPRIPREVRDAAYQAGLGTEPTTTITDRLGISRATMYRLMKQGPPKANGGG